VTVRLHSYFRSSASWRVRIALNWKGIKYEYVPVSLIADGGEHLKLPFGEVNPLHALPALEIDGHVLSESMAILEYLEETHPAPALLPKDPFLRAQARRIAEVFNAGTQPLQNLRVLNRLETLFGANADAKKAWAGYFIQQSFERLEKLLGQTAGKYCVGDDVTIADVGLVPQCYGARRFSVDLARFPLISAIEQRLNEIPAFALAVPTKQPDCPPGQS
jgi:maleylacetoacetate isomerase